MLKTTIEIIPRYEIVYIRNTGPYGLDNVLKMEKLKVWASEKFLLNHDSIILEIAQDDPSVTFNMST